jgi:hypothetical protein
MKISQVTNKFKLFEGGNLAIGPHQAQSIDLTAVERNTIIPKLNQLLLSIDNLYNQTYGEPLWGKKLLSTGGFLSGSSLHFFNVKGISDEKFVSKKPTVGDIDTMVDKNKEQNLQKLLLAYNEKQIGPAKLLGFKRGNEQFSALWEIDDPKLYVQIDFEFVEFEKDSPSEWAKFSHSSAWEDLQAGVKGVFHKYLIQSLAGLTLKNFYLRKLVGRGKLRQEQDVPTSDNMYSFAVSSKEGGGLRPKYDPVIDPATGKPLVVNKLPVMTTAPATGYIRDVKSIFSKLLGHKLKATDIKRIYDNFWSFTGILSAMNNVLSLEEKQKVANDFIQRTIGPGVQGLYKNNPDKDIKEKLVAIDTMLRAFNLSKPNNFDSMLQQYRQSYRMADDETPKEGVVAKMAKNALKEDTPNFKRVGIQHLYNPGNSAELKDLDFIKLCEDLSEQGGNLENVGISLKVDGAGIRFGKDQNGNPFFMTSRVDKPMYKQNIGDFEKYGISQGQNKEQLERTKNYDKALETVVTAPFMKDIPSDTIISAEMLFNPMAIKSDSGLTFVNIPYDPSKLGKIMTIVPISIREFSTGTISPYSNRVFNLLFKNSNPDIKIVNMSLENPGIDVSSIVDPIASNADKLSSAIKQRGDTEAKQKAKEVLTQARKELSEAIYDSPIEGKNQLGDTIEGLVVRMPNGLMVKITSPEMKQKMSAKKNITKKSTTDSNRTKPAFVTIGSFVGHIGHQHLINKTIEAAKKVNGDVYVYVSPSMGPDDPVPPNVKVETLRKLFPEIADNIQTWNIEGSPVKKLEKELVLPANSPYNKIVVVVGEDRVEGFKKWLSALEKRMKDPDAVAKYGGTQNQVDYDVIGIPRNSSGGGNDMSFTRLRNVLKDPNKSEQEQLAAWAKGFDTDKLGLGHVKKVMDISKANMGSLKEQVKLLVSQIKPLLKNATNEQKVKFYNLLKEAKDEIVDKKSVVTIQKESIDGNTQTKILGKSNDYLEEK